MRWLNLAFLFLVTGCTVSRNITFNAQPPDSKISVDGGDPRPQGFTQEIDFKDGDDTHVITASKPGYVDKSVSIQRDNSGSTVEIDLKPYTRKLTFSVTPVPGVVSINGVPISPDPKALFAKELEFTKDAAGNWTHYTISAQRTGFQGVDLNITYTDSSPDYILQLQPMRKDVSIATTPPGATVTVDGESVGVTPLVDKGRAFAYDIDTNQFASRKIHITKAGYDPVDKTISWDNGQTDYTFDVPAKTKTVRFNTDPAGAIVTINGQALQFNSIGQPEGKLVYTPTDDQGTLPVFSATVSKKTAETEWYSQTVQIPWEDGKTDYSATLKEIKTKPVSLTSVSLERNSDGIWEILPRETDTIAWKTVAEQGKEPPVRIYSAPAGTSIGTLTVSPDGSSVIFTVLNGTTKQDFRSQILSVNPDGRGGTEQITPGRALDVFPSFTPDGDSIVFSSNRAGKRLNIWQMSVTGGAGVTKLSGGDEEDLWPMIDAAPKPRLFYEVRVDSRPDSMLYMTPIGTNQPTDLTTIPVMQPRVSPKADAIIFTSVNEKTNNREIYQMPDKGGSPVNLTNDPDSDCYDPVWSKDGSMIAYVSDRGVDEERRRNPDIWLIDLTHPEKQIQITTNGSVDDSPAWDPSGNYLYFRSNRGGTWGIWKIAVK